MTGSLGIAPRDVPRERTPELLEGGDGAVVRFQPVLELVGRVNVEDDGEAAGHQHVERSIQAAQIFGPEPSFAALFEQRRRLDGEPDMVEAELANEIDVALRSVTLQVRLRVIAARSLREPVAQVDAAPQPREPRGRDADDGARCARALLGRPRQNGRAWRKARCKRQEGCDQRKGEQTDEIAAHVEPLFDGPPPGVL
jgi:hypothetical protein